MGMTFEVKVKSDFDDFEMNIDIPTCLAPRDIFDEERWTMLLNQLKEKIFEGYITYETNNTRNISNREDREGK